MNFPYAPEILDFISANSFWAGPIAFVLSMSASILGLNFFVPAAAFLVAAGVMVGAHFLPWTIVLWASLGAAIGTAISYGLGVWLGPRLKQMWPLKTRTEMVERANLLFRRHGFIAVFIGYFYGPLRALIAFVSGVAGMKHLRFEFANSLGALSWSLTAVAQGAIFGTVLGTHHSWLLMSLFIAPIITISLSATVAFLWRTLVKRPSG
jgi:membrane protein DedA with SNARE-associated domain